MLLVPVIMLGLVLYYALNYVSKVSILFLFLLT